MSNKNFRISEFNVSSDHPQLLTQSIPVSVADNLFDLWFYVLQPLRDKYGKPIIVTSGYRNTALNNAVGGVANSQHILGQAADIVAKNRADTVKLGDMIRNLNLPFDQLIYEGTWIHVSYGPRQRRQVMWT